MWVNLISIIPFLEFVFFTAIIYLVISDDRFLRKRKALFIILLLVLYIFSFYLESTPFLLIRDLYWYTLLLNGSFIFHVLILDRLFHCCWKHHWEYLGFLISRISFTLSLSGITYLFKKLERILYYPFSFHEHIMIASRKIKDGFQDPQCLKSRYTLFYEHLWKNHQSFYNFYIFLGYVISFPWKIIKVVLLYFMIHFHNYSLWLLGKRETQFTVTMFHQWLLFLYLSLILGIPRLYLIWAVIFIWEFYNIWNHQYESINVCREFQSLDFIDKCIFTFRNYQNIGYLGHYYEVKYRELEAIYEKPYHSFFMFDLCKFLLDEYEYGESLDAYSRDGTIYESNKYGDYNRNIKFPIIRIYKFYPWEDIALGYYGVLKIIYRDEDPDYRDPLYPRGNFYRLKLKKALILCLLINRDKNFLLKFDFDLKSSDLSRKGTLREWIEDLDFEEEFIQRLRSLP